MASWQTVKDHVINRYNVVNVDDTVLTLKFNWNDGRGQVVLVSFGGNEVIGDWVAVSSPIGMWGAIDLGQAFEFIEDAVCGGLGRIAEYVVVRDAFPLADLSIDELEKPIELIASMADDFEARSAATDRF